jgi:hypothetical protein
MTIHQIVRLLIVPCALVAMAIALPALSAPSGESQTPRQLVQAAEMSVTGTVMKESGAIAGAPGVRIQERSGASYVVAGPKVDELAALDGESVTAHGAATRRADGTRILVVSRFEAAKE